MEYVDNNPKAAIGAVKVPLHLVPPSAAHYLALALKDGAKKYGPYNWRQAGISISTYKSAVERHLAAFWDGQDIAEDSGVHHLAHAMACLALMLDAKDIGKLVDDRPPAGATPALQKEFYEANKPQGKPTEVVVTSTEAASSDKFVIDVTYGPALKHNPYEQLITFR